MISRNARPWSRWLAVCSRCVALGLMVFVSTGVMVGCPKEEPPPPPAPPPPPPPPPPMISVQSLLAEGRFDARLTSAADVQMTDESMARASVRLADAIARGDARAMREMLAPDARATLNDLIASGEWDDATAAIEQVRVIYSAEAVVPSRDAFDLTAFVTGVYDSFLAAIQSMEGGEMTEVLRLATQGIQTPYGNMPLMSFVTFSTMLDAAMRSDPNKPIEDSEFERVDREAAAQLEELLRAGGEASPALGALPTTLTEIAMDLWTEYTANGGTLAHAREELLNALERAGIAPWRAGLILAVQDTGGAYLMAWKAIPSTTSQGGWVFGSETASRYTRARAADWDGIGPTGFRPEGGSPFGDADDPLAGLEDLMNVPGAGGGMDSVPASSPGGF